MKKKTNTLVGGISILAVAGLICKVIGVLFKIPLAHTIGPLGMGVYHQVFPTYNLLLTISSVGIPVAISRMVSGRLAWDDKQGARRIFKVALMILAVFGLIGTLFMMVFSPQLASIKGTSQASSGFFAIAPSLFFVCVMSAFRGFMQGRRRMTPTAISQLVEQVGKVLLSIPLAASGMKSGGYIQGATNALIGISIVEGLAMLYMMADAYLTRHEFTHLTAAHENVRPYRLIARDIVMISVPITIGACIVPIASEVDSFMLVRLMGDYMSQQEALISFGIYTGLVFPLINVPTAFAMATATNLVPSISNAFEKKDFDRIGREANTGLRFASLIGFPFSVGMSMLAFPILNLLFSGDQYSLAQLQKGAQLFEFSSLTILLFTLVQATSGILQGLHKQRIPMYTLAIGVLCKVALNYSLVRIPSINIHGAPLASLLCYTVSALPNLYYCAKYGKFKIKWDSLIWRPLGATMGMGLSIYLMQKLFGARISHSWFYFACTVLVAVVVYAVAAILLKAVTKDDLPRSMRKENKA